MFIASFSCFRIDPGSQTGSPDLRSCQPPARQPHGSALKIRVGSHSIRYPDAFVVCTPVSPRAVVAPDPVVIFEVLSESSAADDFVTKNAEYRDTPSVQRYVVLQQVKATAVVFSRNAGDWVSEILDGADAILRMPEIGIEIPLADIYLGIEIEPDDDPRTDTAQALPG